MCGFFQVIQKGQPIDPQRFRAALSSMRHRGPDQSGEQFVEADVRLADGPQTVHLGFGHQRLAILDLSDKSRQPFAVGQDILLYNGELYNFRELNEGLRGKGHRLYTDGDTETLFMSLLDAGTDALSRFNGMWAFSLFRGAQQTLTLSRDRYGKKPLFYHLDRDCFIVSSTIRAIQIYLNRRLHLRNEVLLEYLTYGDLYPSGTPDTHFAEVSQVLPGHFANFDLATWLLSQHAYFPFFDAPPDPGFDKDPHYLVSLLKDSVRKRLISDRPVGLLLSGGIDSSLILSTLVSLGLQDQCRVYMGDTGRSEDYTYAKQCAEQLGIRAETVVLDYDHNTFDRFLQIIRHQEKPVSLNGSSMGMPQMYEVISSHGVPVVLDGTGGDELFGGYWQRQFPYAVRDAVKQGDWQWLRQQLQCKAGENAVKSHLLRSLLPASSIETTRTTKKKLRAWANPFFKASARAIFNTSPTDPMTRLTLGFTEAMCTDIAPGGRLGEWLWHNDRNSMMSSVEGRSPLLDYRLNAFAYTGYQKKFLSCWNKHELRSAFDALTPLPTQWRQQKQGFRWDGKHFLRNNQGKILELMRENQSLAGLVNIPRLVAAASKQPRLLKSSFCKQVLAISALEKAFS